MQQDKESADYRHLLKQVSTKSTSPLKQADMPQNGLINLLEQVCFSDRHPFQRVASGDAKHSKRLNLVRMGQRLRCPYKSMMITHNLFQKFDAIALS